MFFLYYQLYIYKVFRVDNTVDYYSGGKKIQIGKERFENFYNHLHVKLFLIVQDWIKGSILAA